MKFFATTVLLLLSLAAFGQQTKQEEEVEKQYQESIQKEVERLETNLKLEDWQVFYVDSILVHDYNEMRAELMELQKAKVGNNDIYYDVQDKWNEKIYVALKSIFDESQWQKYLKGGAQKAKKDRDKREAKRNK